MNETNSNDNFNQGLTQIKPNTIGAAPGVIVEKHVEELPISPKVSNDPPVGLKMKKFKIPKKTLVIVGAAILIFFLAIIIPGISIYAKARKILADVGGLQDSLKSQNISTVESSLATFKNDLGSLKSSYQILIWTKFIPFFGGYWSDGNAAINAGLYGADAGQIAIETIKPYADIIGFSGSANKAQSGEETAKDRIDFIIKTVGTISPQLDKISDKVSAAKNELEKINPNRYPKTWAGKPVQSKIRDGIVTAEEASQALIDAKPLIKEAPYILGIDSPRTYLVIFQNDKELRPTGGFITAYSVMKVEKGKASPVSSNDIYNLDKLYRPSIKAPDPIVKYIKGPYVLDSHLRLRDMNFAPDYKDSMDTFSKEIKKVGITSIDGIIAVDTQVLVKILDVIGQIGVPGYGNFSTKIKPECNCPQVIHELESFADIEGAVVWSENEPGKIVFAPPNYENRKKIVGPLMNSVLANALGQPKDKIPALFKAAWESLNEKHVLFYMFDSDAQKAVESFNIAGRIADTPQDGDYLAIYDANLGGRKSNLYTTQEVNQEIKINLDGSIEKTLTITYKNNQGYDGWLNSVLPNWTRVYVPKGSKLISVDGFEDKADPYEEYDKTVFAGGFHLRPEGVVKVTIKYKLPFKVRSEYDLLVQKQPGLDAPLYTTTIRNQQDERYLKSDHLFKFRI